jgi:hypothetical protein
VREKPGDAGLFFWGGALEQCRILKRHELKIERFPGDRWSGSFQSAISLTARQEISSARERPMTVRKTVSPRTSGSKLAQVDAHELKPHEYKDLPELTDDMLKRAVVKNAGRPKSKTSVSANQSSTVP